MTGNRIVLQHVTKIFGEGSQQVVAVDDLSLEVAEGTLVTLLGPSGCGKTTTLRMVAGFEVPTKGEIFIGGVRVDGIPPNKRDTAMVFQSYGLFPHMTVFENVAYGLKVRRVPRTEIRRRVAEVLELTGLKGLEDRAPQQLSGGQQQRVALSRALVVRPQVLLFDEPLSNLDAKLRVEMRGELRKLQKRLSITSLYVTHDQEEAMSISDLLCVMHEGKVQQIGTPSEVYTRPANRFVADFIGQANFLPGVVEQVEDHQTLVRVQTTLLPVPRIGQGFSVG
ncbi:MAG: ABC transporter ATP-binding protein, partial [Nitrospinota bacterium]